MYLNTINDSNFHNTSVIYLSFLRDMPIMVVCFLQHFVIPFSNFMMVHLYMYRDVLLTGLLSCSRKKVVT